MKKINYLLLSLIFGFAFSSFLYLYIFQHPIFISRRALLISFSLGMGSAMLFYVMNKKRIASPDFHNNVYKGKTILISLIITILFLSLFTIPTNYLLAPTVELKISIPASAENNTITIKSLHSGIQDISLHGKDITLTQSTNQIDNGIALNSNPTSISNITWKGRAWDRIFITITNIKLDNEFITFSVNGKNDIYNPPTQNYNDEVVTSLEIPGNSFRKILSFLSVSLCLFISILFLSIQIQISFYKRDHERDAFLKLLLYLIILVYVFISIFPQSPKYRFPNLDSSAYLYIGEGLLQGKIPYKDIWDNKGPILYFINAVGLSIDLGDWGVWFVQVLFIIVSCVLLVKLIQPQSGYLATFVLVILFLRTFTLRLQGGNFTEEYAACFYLLGIYLFWQYLQNEDGRKRQLLLFLIGVVTACSFLTRPNLISPFLAIGITIVIEGLASRKLPLAIKDILKIGGGFILVFGLICLFFIFHHALYDFLDAVFLYNFSYSGTSGQAISKNIVFIFDLYPALMHFACIGSLFILMYYALRKKDLQINYCLFLFSLILSFSLETLICNMSGRNYDHYTFTLIPLAYLLIGLSFDLLISLLKNGRSLIKIKNSTIGFFIVLLLLGIDNSVVLVKQPAEKDDQLYREVSYYMGNNDYLLIWGIGTNILNEINLRSPSKYIYFPTIDVCNYGSQEMVADYILQIEKTKPIIIDTLSDSSTYAINAVHDVSIFPCSKLLPFYEFMSISYEEVGKLSSGYSIYQVIK